MTGYVNVLALALQAADTNGIAQSQTLGGAGNLTLNGDLVTAGVANLVTPQFVAITSGGDDSNKTFTITGTDRYGRPQTETLAGGASTVVNSTKNFLTVSNISISSASTGTVIAGINANGSTAPIIIDRFVNPATYSAAMVFTGTATSSIDISYDDLAPAWDIANNNPTWFSAAGFAALTTNHNGQIGGPITMLRLRNSSGTGSVTATVITPMIANA